MCDVFSFEMPLSFCVVEYCLFEMFEWFRFAEELLVLIALPLVNEIGVLLLVVVLASFIGRAVDRATWLIILLSWSCNSTASGLFGLS